MHCLNFVRAIASRPNCYNYGADRASVIRQVNRATHYLDASMVYGSTLETQRQLRSGQGGRLNALRERGRDFLPLGNEQDCAADSRGCFVAGDPRDNHVPALTALHTLLLREHNRIADTLAASNPSWDDETIFQVRKEQNIYHPHSKFLRLHFQPFDSTSTTLSREER